MRKFSLAFRGVLLYFYLDGCIPYKAYRTRHTVQGCFSTPSSETSLALSHSFWREQRQGDTETEVWRRIKRQEATPTGIERRGQPNT